MPPMTPSPPALVTAAASSGPAATFIPECTISSSAAELLRRVHAPASKIGCWIPKSSVIGVLIDMAGDER
jgi:hypothetical protein